MRNGTIKAYAVLTKDRWPALPDVPSIDEAGVPWLLRLLLARLVGAEGNAEGRSSASSMRAVVNALADATVRQRLADIGQEVWPREQQTPEALAALPQGRNREVVADHQRRRT